MTELARKKLMQKLERDKTATIKELIAHQQLVMTHNDEIEDKFQSEKTKYDQLLNDRMNREE